VLELILQWLTFLTNGVNVMQVLAAARAGYSQRTLGNSPRTAQPGGGECYVVTPTLKWYRKYRSVTLTKLRTYAEKKGLTVNTAKSEVVHFNSKSVSPLQNLFTYDGVVFPEKDRFEYLGMLLDRRMNPKIAEEHAVRPYMAAQSRIFEFAKSHELKSRPHAMLWLSKVYGIPAGMYASQVWGTCI